MQGYFKTGIYLGLSIFFISIGLGCASTHKTTKTETTITYPSQSAPSEGEQTTTTTVTTSNNQHNEGVVEKSETTTTTTDTEAEHPGIISSTFHAIGYVIALPFIIVGGLFRIIFGG